MRLLLVDSSVTGLENCATKIGDLEPHTLYTLQVDLRLSKENDFLLKVTDADLLIFGPEMEERAAAHARAAKEVAPWLPIVVFLSEGKFRNGKFKPERDGDIRKVLSSTAASGEIEDELLSIHSEGEQTLRSDDLDLPKTKLTADVTAQLRQVLKAKNEAFSDPVQPFVIGGRYEVVRILGTGTMGLVYLCKHKEVPGQFVAVKVLFPEVVADKTAAGRFRNEIFAAYGVSHPHVVRAFEYIRDGDMIAFTMEYVDGGSLAERMSKTFVYAIPDVIRLAGEMALGLQAIHDAGIVHRDLKPENILLTKDHHVKITDFGISKTGQGMKLTEHGGVVGTIDYISPEYMLTSQIDARSDIYALGILFYEMVAGRPPFIAESVYATMTKRIKTDPEPPSTFNPQCPAALDAIILKAMHRLPEQRFQSASELYKALHDLSSQSAATKISSPPPRAPAKRGELLRRHLNRFNLIVLTISWLFGMVVGYALIRGLLPRP